MKPKPYQLWRLAGDVINLSLELVYLATKAVVNNAIKRITGGNAQGNRFLYSRFEDIDQEALTKMVWEKNLDQLQLQFRGTKTLAEILGTTEWHGIIGNDADLMQRKNIFGSNKFPKPPAKRFLSFVLEAFKDTTIIILLVCAILSLGFGIKQRGVKEGWYDGGSIVFAIILVEAVFAVCNFRQSRQFKKLSEESRDMRVEVVRDGRRQHTSVFDVVVGDIVCLNIGDQIPADGLLMDGHSLEVDHMEIDGGRDPFLLSGTEVTDGCGYMLVTSVGINSAWCLITSLTSRDLNERQTRLQARVKKLTSCIGKVGLAVAFLVLVVLLVRYFTGSTRDELGNGEFNGSRKTGANDVMNEVVRIIAVAVTIVAVAIPEGLSLAVTLILAFSMKQMMAENALVRKPPACETMRSVTTICTDKTGILTENQMKVTEFFLGKHAIEDAPVIAPNALEFLQQGVGASVIAPNALEFLQQSLGLNTGATHTPIPEISGSPTEKALRSWAKHDLGMDIDKLKGEYEILHVKAFNSEKKRSGVVTRSISKNAVQTHWKGAAERILAICSTYHDKSGTTKAMDEEDRMQFRSIIKEMELKSLRCIAFAHKIAADENGIGQQRFEESGLNLLGIVGLKDPCRAGVKETVESCRHAGVNVKMITGDSLSAAKAIATECGILGPTDDLNSGAIVEGENFSRLSVQERMEKVDTIRVMARSSPYDKLLMVGCLKQKGHVIAVTGDGTNDAAALKEADIGLSMGIQGTEVAKQSSDIVILDDNFNSLVTALKWGRCVYNNIQKFIQFQLTVNVAALVINFVAAVSSGEVPLTAVQLLWVNLLMDTLGALAFATEPPSELLMSKPPVGRHGPLITTAMWCNVVAQALFQATALLILHFKGCSMFGVNEKVKNTLIFNSFVLCQVYKEFNSRKLEERNLFKRIREDKLFLGIIGITIVVQVVMVEFLTSFLNTERLSWKQWAACVTIATMTWPINWLVDGECQSLFGI